MNAKSKSRPFEAGNADYNRKNIEELDRDDFLELVEGRIIDNQKVKLALTKYFSDVLSR